MSNIKIKISNEMISNDGIFCNENSLLRAPSKLREELNLAIGQDLTLGTTDGSTIILRVNQAYAVDAAEDETYCFVTKETFDKINIKNSEKFSITPVTGITLGCDPEFFIVDRQSSKLLRANAFFKKWGEVGNDGVLAEIRPKPSLTPEGLTANISELIATARQVLQLGLTYPSEKIKLVAASSYRLSDGQPAVVGTYGFATAGFHLHYGLPSKILGNTPEVLSLMFGISNIMDYFVSIPCMVVEGADYTRRTNNHLSYGKPGDFRLDYRTFEYRVPGGVMLKNPILTNGLISLGAVVIGDVVSRIKAESNNFTNLQKVLNTKSISKMYPEVPSIEDMFNIICSPEVGTATQHLDKIYSRVENMIGFGEKSKAINAFFECIDNNEVFSNDMESNWRNERCVH